MAPSKKTPAAAAGQMPLMEHIRELRSRLVKSVIGIFVGVVIAWVFYPFILDWLTAPYEQVRPDLEAKNINTQLVMTGIGGGFQFQLKVSVITGIILSSPVWMWQLWAFILPAMFKHERRIAIGLTALCVPLFVGGAWLGYWVFPKAILLLVGFVPSEWVSLLSGADYLTFALRMMILFGIGAQWPVVIVILNRLGVISGKQLVQARPWIIVGLFVFSAVATPTMDPITFLFLGIPMSFLHLIAERLAVFGDKRRAAKVPDWDDESASDIDDPTDV